MPTINSAIATMLVTGAPGKVPASLLAAGETGFDFQTLLGATTVAAPPIADPAVRQPLAVDGTALPPDAVTTAPLAAAPSEILPAVAVAKAAPPLMPTPPADEPELPRPDTLAPIVAPVATPMPRQQPIVLAKAAPKKEDGKPARNADEPETPADPAAPLLPLPTVVIPQPVMPPVTIARAKTSPLPLISVVRAPADRPVIAAAIPQMPRDIRWDGAAPVVTPLAAPVEQMPRVESPPAQIVQPISPVVMIASAPGSEVEPEAAPVAAMPSPAPRPVAPMPVAVPPAFAAAPAPIVAGPALQVFGAAISAAARHERTEDTADPLASLGTIAAPAISVAAPVTTDQPMLDMRQERWPQAMIAHIESLRDNANATDTRIRLVPDALGMIDVAVTRDRDTVHVQFTAEQATTRALIQDAQPRLAALAEERGLRLGQTVVDASAAGAASQQSQQSQQPQHQRQPQRDAALPAAPRRTTDNQDDQDRADDGRLA